MEKKFFSDEMPLDEILGKAKRGELQLPDFQRGWVWDDDHIRSLLASISLSYPIGAVMTLVAGNPDVNFKARLLEGVTLADPPPPDMLLLDGQQRLTSLFQALKLRVPVCTRDGRGNDLHRHYYADINACIDPDADREETGIFGIPSNRLVLKDFGKTIELDLRTRDREIAEEVFPLDIVLDPGETTDWQLEYLSAGSGDAKDRIAKWKRFQEAIISPFLSYQVPTINLAKSTPKEAVCQVFEKVNTGGVTLTVFELLTATYAASSFELRKDWDKRHARLAQHKLLEAVEGSTFLQIVTLLATYDRHQSHLRENPEDEKAPAVSCKRRDILRLPLDAYRRWADRAEGGLERTVSFLRNHCIFRYKDLPYATQLVPLAAIFGWMEDEAETYSAQQRLGRWYWCGVLGEMYGSALESRFAIDLEDCVSWITGGGDSTAPRTVQAAQLQSERLLSLRTRGSAAYKGLYALQMKQGARSFKTRQPIDVHTHEGDSIDIHQVFPKKWRESSEIERKYAACIVNKIPLAAHTASLIGDIAPSTYLSRIETSYGIEPQVLDGLLRSHGINPLMLRRDDFQQFFNQRFEALLRYAERAMGKPVNRGPDSQPFPDLDLGPRIPPDESAVLEFKSTALRNLHTKRADPAITWAVIKTVAAFMNTHGGTLLVGVDDQGRPVGIEEDYDFVKKPNRDSWGLWLNAKVGTALGPVAATDLLARFCMLDGRTVARIDVSPGTKPVFAKRKGDAKDAFYVRSGAATVELSGRELADYIEKHWHWQTKF